MRWAGVRLLFVLFMTLFAIAPFIGCREGVERAYDDALGVDGSAGSSGSSGADVEQVDGKTLDDPSHADAGPTGPAKIGGTVLGLIGSPLVLQNNGGDDLEITAGGAFTFPTALPPGATYNVTVRTQPSAPTQTCTVANETGTAKGVDVVNVTVTCITTSYPVGGTVVGLTGTGLVLLNNGGNDKPITGNGPFSFSQPVPSGANFNVTVKTQPSGPAQTCSVSGATGTVVAAPVDSIVVNCGTNTYTVGGTVTGLAGTLMLRNNGGDDRTISANGSFAFSTPISSGANYSVTVKTQPAYPPKSQTCTIANGSGAVSSSNVTNVAVTCTTNTYTVGGNVTGLSGTGLVLQNNGGNNKSISAAGPFTFGTPVASGSAYSVTVLTQPSGQVCSVSAGAGTVTSANVSNVAVSCTTPVALSQNFDGVTAPALPSGWSTSVVTGSSSYNPWRTATGTVNSAPNAAFVNNYDDSSNIILTSPAFTVATSTAQLTFWNWYDTEDYYDGGVLEISINGGAFQDILTAGGSFVAGGYNLTLDTDTGNPIGGRQAWSGTGNVQTTANLPAAAAGKSVALRWRFGSDSSYSYTGWRIDNVVVNN